MKMSWTDNNVNTIIHIYDSTDDGDHPEVINTVLIPNEHIDDNNVVNMMRAVKRVDTCNENVAAVIPLILNTYGVFKYKIINGSARNNKKEVK